MNTRLLQHPPTEPVARLMIPLISHPVVEVASKVPFEGMTVTPEFFGTPQWEPLLFGAWAGLVTSALRHDEAHAAFKRDTGHDVAALAGRSPISQLIDQATSHERTVLAAWCDWVTVNFWGVAE